MLSPRCHPLDNCFDRFNHLLFLRENGPLQPAVDRDDDVRRAHTLYQRIEVIEGPPNITAIATVFLDWRKRVFGRIDK